MTTPPPGDDDATIVALLQRQIEGKEFGWGSRYTLSVRRTSNHQVEVEIHHDGHTARLRLALPTSQRPMPWLTPLTPANHLRIVAQRSPTADDWVNDLLDMLNEEMDTGGIADRATYTDSVGHSWMTVEGYGLRLADSAEHHRLRGHTGPDGLYTGSRRRIRLQYALEWALDQVETQLRPTPATDRKTDQHLWHLTSPDGVEVTVLRTDHDQDWDLLASTSHHCGGQTASRRLSHP